MHLYITILLVIAAIQENATWQEDELIFGFPMWGNTGCLVCDKSF